MRRLLISSAGLALLAACAPVPGAMSGPMPVTVAATPSAATRAADARLENFFEAAYQERIALSPQQMTALGIKTGYDRLDDYTEAADDRSLALVRAQLARMKAEHDFAALGPQSQLSWRLFEASNASWPMNAGATTAMSSPPTAIRPPACRCS